MNRRYFIKRLPSGILGVGSLALVNSCRAPLISEAEMAAALKKLGA